MAALATAVNPITLAINAGSQILSLGMKLLANHDERITVAKEENAAVKQAVATMDNDLATIFKAANAGEITAIEAMAACQDVSAWYWQFVNPLIQGPTKGPTKAFPGAGTSDYYAAGSGAACHCAGEKIGNVTGCTAGCCIGCAAVDPTLSAAWHVFANGGGSFQTAVIVANKYGLPARASYTLSYKKPAVVHQAELTLNTKSGVVTVGAPAGQNDLVVASGGISTTAAPDQGGVVPVAQLNAVENGPSQTNPTGVPALGSLGGMTLYLIIGAIALVFLVLLRGNAAPQVEYVPVGR